MMPRPLTPWEAALVRALLVDAPGLAAGLDAARVIPMRDGGMGSLRFTTPDEAPTRRFGRVVGERQFTDRDGTPVFVSLVVDEAGCLFELDVWRADFGPLQDLPKVSSLAIERWNKLAVAESWGVGSDVWPSECADPRTPGDVQTAHISEVVVVASGASGLIDGFTLQRVLITLIRDLTALVPAADYDISDGWTIHYRWQNDLRVRLSLRFFDKTTLFDETLPYADALMVVTHLLASLYDSLERCGADINAENRLFCSDGTWLTFDLSWRPF